MRRIFLKFKGCGKFPPFFLEDFRLVSLKNHDFKVLFYHDWCCDCTDTRLTEWYRCLVDMQAEQLTVFLSDLTNKIDCNNMVIYTSILNICKTDVDMLNINIVIYTLLICFVLLRVSSQTNYVDNNHCTLGGGLTDAVRAQTQGSF